MRLYTFSFFGHCIMRIKRNCPWPIRWFLITGQSTGAYDRFESDLADTRASAGFDVTLNAQRSFAISSYGDFSIDLDWEIDDDTKGVVMADRDFLLTYDGEFTATALRTKEGRGVGIQYPFAPFADISANYEEFAGGLSELKVEIGLLPPVQTAEVSLGIRNLYYIQSTANRAYNPLPSLNQSLEGCTASICTSLLFPRFWGRVWHRVHLNNRISSKRGRRTRL